MGGRTQLKLISRRFQKDGFLASALQCLNCCRKRFVGDATRKGIFDEKSEQDMITVSEEPRRLISIARYGVYFVSTRRRVAPEGSVPPAV
jgi:hypothetical protein